MAKRKRRNFTAEFKAEVVLEALNTVNLKLTARLTEQELTIDTKSKCNHQN